ncbi:uncharacterized protein LOC144710896 [Wolffia australiana]
MSTAFFVVTLRTNLLPRVFGCTAYVHDTTPTLTKLDARALTCIFAGYSSLQKRYKCYHPSTRWFFISANVTFAEFQPFFGSSSSGLSPGEASSSPTLDPFPVVEPTAPSPTDVARDPLPPSDSSPVVASDPCPSTESPPQFSSTPPLSPPSELSAPTATSSPSTASAPSSSGHPSSSASPGADDASFGWPIALRKGFRQCTRTPLYPVTHYLSYDRLSPPYCLFLTRLAFVSVPHRLADALACPHWKAAMDEEMHALVKNHTWDVVPLPPGKKAVGCKWVHTPKHRADGSIERRKSHLVARGFT